MDKVGEEGKGESVWLAFFLFEVLQRFAEVADRRGDATFATECREQARNVAANVEQNAWDGQWYRRAYFDDGKPLGSHENEECQIDSISQSWGVLSGAANAERVQGAMQQVDQRLVRRDYGLIQLPESRLHPRLRAGRARERRPVHARGHMDSDGLRQTGRCGTRVGADAHD
jgi:cellobiose phosphorylase